MSVIVVAPPEHCGDCNACEGSKGAPIAAVVSLVPPWEPRAVRFNLCEVCARDLANALGFFCIKGGGWSKLEPRRRRTP